MVGSRSITRRTLIFGALAGPALAARPPSGLVEPHMRLAPTPEPTVALTLDACDGRVDRRILSVLVEERIATTIFVAGPWLRSNPAAFRMLLDAPDLFEIGDHGAHHRAAIDRPMRLWNVPSAGSLPAVATEVTEGSALLIAAGASRPRWYRGATALYTKAALTEIAGLGYRIAGFSLNADGGASFGAAETARRITGAQPGDVLIAHVNQPTRPAGAGVAAGLRALKQRGFRFVRLSDPAISVVSAA